jgi:hypothetical protein
MRKAGVDPEEDMRGELEADELDAGAAEEPPEAELDEEAETLEEVGAAATSSWRL